MRSAARPRRGPRLLFVIGAVRVGQCRLHRRVAARLRDDGDAAVSLTPGPHPLRALASAIAARMLSTPPPEDAGFGDFGAWLADLQDTTAPDDGERDGVKADAGDSADSTDPEPGAQPGDTAPPPVPERLAIVVDQFEELFTACDDERERSAFLSALTRLASHTSPCCVVVIGLRVDFYSDLVATGQWTEALQDNQVLVEPMRRAELTGVIVEPANRAGVAVDEALVELILDEFIPPGSIDEQHDPGALPLLSHALLETWHHARRGRMTIADYQAAGGIRGAVEESAENAFAEVGDEQQAAQRMFLRLVNIDPHNVATRHVARRDELAGLAAGPDNDDADWSAVATTTFAASVMAPFVDARLVTACTRRRIEIAHEALLAAWPRLRGWIDEGRETIVLRRRIGDATPGSGSTTTAAPVGPGLGSAAGDHAAGGRRRGAGAPHPGRARLPRCQRGPGARRRARPAGPHPEPARGRRGPRWCSPCWRRRSQSWPAISAPSGHARDGRAVLGSSPWRPRPCVTPTRPWRPTWRSGATQWRRPPRPEPPCSRRRTCPSRPAMPAASDPLRWRHHPATASFAAHNAVDGTVQLFNQTVDDQGNVELERRGTIEVGAPGDVVVYSALALTPDHGVLAVGDTTAAVDLWDVTDPDSPEHLAGPLTGLDGPVNTWPLPPTGASWRPAGWALGSSVGISPPRRRPRRSTTSP